SAFERLAAAPAPPSRGPSAPAPAGRVDRDGSAVVAGQTSRCRRDQGKTDIRAIHPTWGPGFHQEVPAVSSYKHYPSIASDQTSSSRAFIWMRADDRDRRTNFLTLLNRCCPRRQRCFLLPRS